MRPHTRVLAAKFGLLLALSGSQAALADSIYAVTVDTASLSGTGATLAFDLTSGGTSSNDVSISAFTTDGSLGANGPNSGSVSGALLGAVTLAASPSSFFNEYLQGTALGSTISFQLDATTNRPTGIGLPDTFALFVLDPTATYSLPTTSDPTGADSLFTLQIDGSSGGIVSNYGAGSGVGVTLTTVPEPGTLGLMALGLLGAIRAATYKKRRS